MRLIAILTTVGLLLSGAFLPGQETTAGVQGVVKDQSGAVVADASVVISSASLIGEKRAQTDTSGFYRFSGLPPGSYTLSVTAKGFKGSKREGIALDAGRLPSLDIQLEVGQASEIVEVSGQAPLVDVTQSKVAVTIAQDQLESIPKGRSFQSVIPFAPGARQEPMQSSRTDQGRLNGFQIDGASDAENVYMSEGLNTTAIYGGGVGSNVPMEFVQEVQVKSSSFEAEFGGATGGVVNVIQKRGGSRWHGSVFSYYQGSPLNANDNCINRAINSTVATCNLRLQPGTSLNSGSAASLWANRLDGTAQRYVWKQDKWDIIEPGYEIGGPLFSNRLAVFSSYVPSLSSVTRTVNFTGSNSGPHSFLQAATTQNFMNRLDYRLSNSIRLFAAWQSAYQRVKGNVNMPVADSAFGQVNNSAGTDPNTLRQDTGFVAPQTVLNFGGDISLGSKMVATVRYGWFYANNEDRGKTTGTRYVWQADSTCSAADPFGCTLPAAAQQSVGYANIPNNQQFSFDIFERRQLSADAAYFIGHFGGTHNFKVGYALARQAEDVAQTFNTSLVLVWMTGTDSYTTASGDTSTVCASVIAKYGKCAGPFGYYILRDGVNTNGNVSSNNHSIYIQDGWTIRNLTINAGVRLDKEFLPPYRQGAESISFGFGQKVAPRIGVAYDLLRNGKVKLYASYGKFFDIMKYSLPRGSFGGDRWHDCVFSLTTSDVTQIVPNNIGGKFCPDSGQPTGSLPGDFIENQNWRASAPSPFPNDPVVDPHMHPMSTHEYVAGADLELRHNLALESRYARKRLDWTIEDMSLDDGQYYIGNPGSAYSQLLHRPVPTAGYNVALCPTCPNLPKAIRNYDGLEFRLIRRGGQNWFGQLSYTYSRLYGNYAGLSNTYFLDGNGGRHEPNNGRAFDLPQMLFDGQGHAVGGPLPTDRPHAVGAVGYYRLRWFNMETLIGANQEIASGAPQSTCLPTVDSQSSCMFVAGQGNWINFHQDPTTADIVQDSITKGKREPWLSSTDLSLTHELKVSQSNEALRLAFGVNVFNVFNQHAPITLYNSPLAGGYTTPIATPQTGCVVDPTTQKCLIGWDYLSLMNNFDYNGLMNNKTVSSGKYAGPNTNGKPNTLASRYGQPVFYQTARALRLQVKFTF
jgi:hypothetical protein